MNNPTTMTIEQIHQAGIQALTEKLGVIGMIRFLQQFENGQGDYTKERHQWLDEQSLEDIIHEANTKYHP